jgi:AcrR family transcriptional regulator
MPRFASAEEARVQILAAARSRLAGAGSTNISEVAEDLGVTRQTVYRYFPTSDHLVDAAALDAVAEMTDRLGEHVRRHLTRTGGDAGDAAVEVVAFVYEHLRGDPALDRMVAPGRLSGTVAGLTAPESIALGRELLTGFGLDWVALGLDDEAQRELVEHLLRTLQTLVLDPGNPPRSGDEVRAYLQRWLAPALRDRTAQAAGGPVR